MRGGLVGLSLLLGWGVCAPCAARAQGEIRPQQGQVEAQYQPGGLGDLDRYGWRVAADFGAREDLGLGLAVTRLFGADGAGFDVHTTFGELYVKYQFKERERPQDLAASVLGGYRFVRERGETRSGAQIAVVGDLPLAPQVAAHARLGVSLFENNEMIDFLLGAGYALQQDLDLNVALQVFSVDSVTEGGILVGLTYRYRRDTTGDEDASW